MSDPVEPLTRRGLRHQLLRARNERIRTTRDTTLPRLLTMNAETRAELLIDDDPAERWSVDFEGRLFMDIPIQVDDRLAFGIVTVLWPEPADG